MTANLGAVEVDVHLNVQDVGQQLRRAVRRPAEQIGEQLERQWERSGGRAGQAYGEAFSERAAPQISNTVFPTGRRGGADRAGRSAGREYGQSFQQAANRQFQRRGNPFNPMTMLRGMSFDRPIASLARLTGAFASTTTAGAGLMAVVSPLGVAIGGLGAAATSAAGSIALLPALLSGASASVATLVTGFQGMGEALGAAFSDDPAEFTEALEQLEPAAQGVARAFRDLAPQLSSIQNTVQQNLFAGLADEITQLGDHAIPALERGMGRLSTGLNSNLEALFSSLGSQANAANLEQVFNRTADAAEALSPGIRSAVNAFSDLSAVGSEFLPDMADYLSEAAESFEEFIANARETGELRQFIDQSVDSLQQLGRMARDAAVSIGNVFSAAGEAGLDDQLESMIAGFREFTSSAQGQDVMGTFFDSLSRASEAAGPVFGALAETIATDLAPALADLVENLGPGFTDFIDGLGDAISEASPGLSDLASSLSNLMSEVAPNMGDLGSALGSMASSLSTITDGVSGAVSAFNSFNSALGGVPGQILAVSTAMWGLSRATKAAMDGIGGGGRRRGRRGGLLGNLSGDIKKETDKAEKEARKGGKKIGKGLRGGLRGFLGKAGLLGMGAMMANDLIEGFTGVDVAGEIGRSISEGTEVGVDWGELDRRGQEQLRSYALGLQNSIGAALEIKVPATFGDMRRAFNEINTAAKKAEIPIRRLVNAAANGDSKALDQLRNKLGGIDGLSSTAKAYLDQLMSAAASGNFSGLNTLQQHLNSGAAAAERYKGLLDGLLNFDGAPQSPILPLPSLGDGVQEGFRPPGFIGPMVGELNELGEAGKNAQEGVRGLYDGLLQTEPAALNLNNTLQQGGVQFANYSTAAQNAGLASQNWSTSIGQNANWALQAMSTALQSMTGINQSSWAQMLGVAQSQGAALANTAGMSANQAAQRFQGGLNGMMSANNSAWRNLLFSTRSGGANVVGEANSIAQQLSGSFSGLSQPFYQSGLSAMMSLAGGITAGGGAAIAAAQGVAAAIAASAAAARSQSFSPQVGAGVGGAPNQALSIGDGDGGMRPLALETQDGPLKPFEGNASRTVSGVNLSGRRAIGDGAYESGLLFGRSLASGIRDSGQRAIEEARVLARQLHQTAPELPSASGTAPRSGGGGQAPVQPSRTVNNHWTVNTAAQDPRAVAAALRTRFDDAAAGVS